MSTKDRIRALRTALGLTQEQVADRGGLDRTEVNKLEAGKNQATTDRIRASLAVAFASTRDDIAAYLEDRIGLDEILARIRNPSLEKARRAARELALSEQAIAAVTAEPGNDVEPLAYLARIVAIHGQLAAKALTVPALPPPPAAGKTPPSPMHVPPSTKRPTKPTHTDVVERGIRAHIAGEDVEQPGQTAENDHTKRRGH